MKDTNFTGNSSTDTHMAIISSFFLKTLFSFFLSFLDMDHLKSLCCTCYNIVSVLSFGFLAVRHADLSSPTED